MSFNEEYSPWLKALLFFDKRSDKQGKLKDKFLFIAYLDF